MIIKVKTLVVSEKLYEYGDVHVMSDTNTKQKAKCLISA